MKDNDMEKKQPEAEIQPQTPEAPEGPPDKKDPPTPLSTRIMAGLGALFVILVTLAFAYSISTGDVFRW